MTQGPLSGPYPTETHHAFSFTAWHIRLHLAKVRHFNKSEYERDLMDRLKATIFGSMKSGYYFRQLVFGAIIGAIFISGKVNASPDLPVGEISMAVISTLLYPYARFVYESIVGFIMGNNLFVVPALLMLLVKVITMFMCWFLAIFIAPIGLGYIYWKVGRPSAN